MPETKLSLQVDDGARYQKLLTPTISKLPKRLQFGEIKKRFQAVSPSVKPLGSKSQAKFSFAANDIDDADSDIYSVIKIEEDRGYDGARQDESFITTSDDS